MKSMPRISFSLSQMSAKDPEFESFVAQNVQSKPGFRAVRRELKSTKFIEDPDLVAKHQKEIEAENTRKRREAEEIQQNVTILSSISNPSPPERKKIKREKSEIKEKNPPKKVTKSEITQIVSRLSYQYENISPKNVKNNTKTMHTCKTNATNQKNYKRKKASSSIQNDNDDSDSDAVFDRLFFESTKIHNKRKYYQDLEYNKYYTKPEKSETEEITTNLAFKKMKEFIDSIFVDVDNVISYGELYDIFVRVGILNMGEKVDNYPVLVEALERWRVNTNTYNALKVKDSLILAISGKSGRFRQFAKERIHCKFANHKNNENYVQETPSMIIHKAKQMTQDTFDRLLSPRPDFTSQQKTKEEEDVVYEPIQLSANTQKILRNSSLGKTKIEKRDQALCERAMKKINEIREKMEEDFKKMQKPPPIVLPEISPEERKKIDELKKKRQNTLPEEQPYKPDIMKYKDFLAIKEEMKKNTVADQPGLDSFLQRMKKGYEQHIKKIQEEENIRALPELPSKRRARTSLKKMNPAPPPPVVHEEEEDKINEEEKINAKGKKKRQKRSSSQMSKSKQKGTKAAKIVK
ncbi:hypothetical protein TRFO_42046 [Tritrichomonas foetus]|uniref:Uncharacterized protein n=1 Tax=Tritrichomonas foetus TaxID=1144522 RepID=A0A1J4KZ06_9EUKA|nr:hypothetical protein TRFO_42046 [Tritrichomonas foetus]|eukprot:OHT16096.1 hypothetical protein TRFO_42046 [Tritrichomonas foetus]